jgi:hypothetical protein
MQAISEQFRRFANVYFLVVGGIMFVGQYTTLFDTAISPWTTLGPLAMVISISLTVEAISDYKRHMNDHETNNADCTILDRASEGDTVTIHRFDASVCNGKPVVVTDAGRAVGFSVVARKDIRQGHLVLVKNREMVPGTNVVVVVVVVVVYDQHCMLVACLFCHSTRERLTDHYPVSLNHNSRSGLVGQL